MHWSTEAGASRFWCCVPGIVLLHVLRDIASRPGGHEQEFPCIGRPKGQGTLELLAACSMANHPADIVLTDGCTYHILRLRGKKLIIWADLPAATALAQIAHVLRQVNVPCQPLSLSVGSAFLLSICLHRLSSRTFFAVEWTPRVDVSTGHALLFGYALSHWRKYELQHSRVASMLLACL